MFCQTDIHVAQVAYMLKFGRRDQSLPIWMFDTLWWQYLGRGTKILKLFQNWYSGYLPILQISD